MKRWRFALSRRWFGYLAFAIVFAIACGFLSAWQLARSKEAADANALIASNFNSAVAPLTQVLPQHDSYDKDQEWLRASATGTYVPNDQFLVRNRPTSQGPGFEVLTPLRLEDGALFIVDRGWVRVANKGDKPEEFPEAPAGSVTVTVRLKASEPHIAGRTSVGNQLGTIQLSVIEKKLDAEIYTRAYGLLESQNPAGKAGLTPVVTNPPTRDEGLHWSYMIQWVIFALIGFFGLGYAVRQEYKIHNSNDPAIRARENERAHKKDRRPKTDAEAEDELLEQASR